MKSECFLVLVLVLGPMKAEELMYKQIMFGWFLHYTFVFLGPKCFHLFSHEPDFLPVSCCSNIFSLSNCLRQFLEYCCYNKRLF